MERMIESLEDRRLLSATLTNGVLDVEGTKSNDNITVSLSSDGSTITVSESKARRGHKSSAATTTTFAAADVTSVVVNAGKGNDNVLLKGSLATPATINGG